MGVGSLLIAATLTVWAVTAGAQGSGGVPAAGSSAPKSAVEAMPDLLSGTLSAGGDLAEDEVAQPSWLRRPTAMDPWFAWKREVREKYGLTFGGSWGVMWQSFSSSLVNEHQTVGSKLTLNFSYDIANRRQPDALTFDLAVEDRRPLGTEFAPLQAGLRSGSIVPPAATWGEFDLGISQAYLRQNLFANHFQWTVGKVFAPNFIDAFPFFDDNRQFYNQQFSTNPTIAAPLRGFGAVAAWYPTESGLYIKPGVFTNYSSDTGSTVEDFFRYNERFYMLEGGISGLARSGVAIQARGPTDADNVHVTGWYRDPTSQTGQARAYGVAFNANSMWGENTLWFLRAGWSEGWIADRSVSAGLGWRPPQHAGDLFGIGVGWTRPTNRALDAQTTAEIFYRFMVTPNFAITPDLQVVLDPSLDPSRSALWIGGVRARITF